MRAIAILPLICVCASVVLTVLCILAGYQQGFLNNFELVTFNTSLLGEGVIEAAAGNILSQIPGASDLLATSTTPSLAARATIPASIVSAVSSAGSEIIEEVASRLGIHDFYNLHILDFCEGYYEPGPVPNATFSTASQNVTYCSPAQAFSFFNATEVLENELLPGYTLSQIQFPTEIQDALSAMATVQRVMFVLYVIGAGFGAIAAFEAIIAFLVDGRISAVCNAVTDIIAFIALGIASGCATAFIYIVTNAVNDYGAQVNLQAYRGNNFLIITWIATVLPLVASVLWCIDCCAGPSRKRKSVAYD